MNWIPDLAQQCCDTFEYQQMGQQCANNGMCYDPLRPVGAVLWFSLPDRLHTSFAILNILHIVLCGLSIVLSTRVLYRLAAMPLRKWHVCLLLLLSTLVHTLYFSPVLFVSLTDAPAGLCALCGLWCLLLWQQQRSENQQGSVLLLAVAGLCLGFAAWLRVYYLHPLLLMLLVYVLSWLQQPSHPLRELAILTALIPLLLQLGATWQQHGYLGYLERSTENRTLNFHMNMPVIGYDTVLPGFGYSWLPTWCTLHAPSAENGLIKYRNIACVMPERLQFYFGSYAAATYASSDSNILMDQSWTLATVAGTPVTAPHVSPEPAFNMRINAPVGEDGNLRQPASLQRHTPYTLSVWLWAPQPRTITLSLSDDDQLTVASKTVAITTDPVRYSFTTTTHETTRYAVQITIHALTGTDNAADAGVNIWQPQLEQGVVAREFRHNIAPPADTVRNWSFILLLANTAALLAGLALLWRTRRVLCAAHYASVLFLSLILAEGLLFVPEQRFMVVFNTALWLLCALALLLAIHRRRFNHITPASVPESIA